MENTITEVQKNWVRRDGMDKCQESTGMTG